jgi:lipoprotein NlpD
MRWACRVLSSVSCCLLLAGCGAHVTHVVQKGDTLYSIGFRYQQDHRQLAEWNELRPPYTLRPGQSLRVAPPRAPSHGERLAAARNPAPPAQPRPAGTPERAPVSIPSGGAVSVPLAKPAPAPRPAPAVAASAQLHWHWPVRNAVSRGDATVKPFRRGLDIRAARGEPVVAAADGRVVYGGSGIPHYGNLLIIKHDERYLSAYAHNQRLLVAEGEQVRAGQRVAEMGDTGTGADGVKLHFEIRLDGTPVDPLRHLPGK